jgi:hypothetical protein
VAPLAAVSSSTMPVRGLKAARTSSGEKRRPGQPRAARPPAHGQAARRDGRGGGSCGGWAAAVAINARLRTRSPRAAEPRPVALETGAFPARNTRRRGAWFRV